MKAKRVLVLLHELSQTGAPRLTIDTLDGIRELSAVRIVSWAGGPLLESARKIGPTVVLRRDVVGGSSPLPARASFRAIRGGAAARVRGLAAGVAIRRWKPDVVYVSSVWSLPLVRRLGLSGVPILLQVQEMGSALASFQRINPGILTKLPDRYIAVSEAVARDLAEVGVRPDLISIVRPHCLLTETHRKPRDNDSGPCLIGGAGNPSWTKGVDLWLLAARAVVDRLGPDRARFSWLHIRDNEEGLRFRAMVAKLGLADVVELLPQADDPSLWFGRLDVFAMSSWEDSSPLVVLEAMASGVPVVCFEPSGGAAESVGEAGIVLPRISPDDMADAIVKLVGDPRRRAALGEAGAARVAAFHSRAANRAGVADALDRTAAGG